MASSSFSPTDLNDPSDPDSVAVATTPQAELARMKKNEKRLQMELDNARGTIVQQEETMSNLKKDKQSLLSRERLYKKPTTRTWYRFQVMLLAKDEQLRAYKKRERVATATIDRLHRDNESYRQIVREQAVKLCEARNEIYDLESARASGGQMVVVQHKRERRMGFADVQTKLSSMEKRKGDAVRELNRRGKEIAALHRQLLLKDATVEMLERRIRQEMTETDNLREEWRKAKNMLTQIIARMERQRKDMIREVGEDAPDFGEERSRVEERKQGCAESTWGKVTGLFRSCWEYFRRGERDAGDEAGVR